MKGSGKDVDPGELWTKAPVMIDVAYDPEADAAYVSVGRGKIEDQRIVEPFIFDVDADGRVVGIEILSGSKVPGPGEPATGERPGARVA